MRFGENINYLWKMKKLFLITLLFCSAFSVKAQNLILNGSFEYNNCQSDRCFDLTDVEYNQIMDSSISFGYNQNLVSNGDIDLLKGGVASFTGFPIDTVYAQNGDWLIQIADFGDYYLYPTIFDTVFADTLFDAFSLELSDTLEIGTWYKLSFYFRKAYRPGINTMYRTGRLKVGASTFDDSFGVLIDTSVICDTIWLQQSFTFQATDTFRYVTCQPIREQQGVNYLAVDNFVLVETTEPVGIIENNKTKKLLKIVDILGRESKSKKGLLFYIYSDGTVEKKLIIE